MKKTQTPISSSIGNHDTRMLNSDGTLSSIGAAVMRTCLSVSRLTRLGSFGAYVEKGRPSVKWPLMLLPWIVTSATCPRLTSLMKSEKGRLACGPRVDEVWNRLNSATSNRPMMIQSARFLPKLFTNPGLSFRAARKIQSNHSKGYVHLLHHHAARADQRSVRADHSTPSNPTRRHS